MSAIIISLRLLALFSLRDHLPHLFRDPQGTFQAEIVEVAPDGTLWLRRHDDCRLASYAFKEIEYIITEQP